MAADRTTLIVVPVKGTSQGLPGKGVRLLAGVPVVSRVLETVLAVPDADVIVVTDSSEVTAIADQMGVFVLGEPEHLPTPRTLDPLVHWAVGELERRGHGYQRIATVQATSPFLRAETIEQCIREFGMTVRDDRHLRLGSPWVERQAMPSCWRVTGGCMVIRRVDLTPTRRVSTDAHTVEVRGAEALDLDTPEDWAVAEMYAGMTTRELLLARVLGEKCPTTGLIVTLSAWDEEREETEARMARAMAMEGRLVQPMALHTYAEAHNVLSGAPGRMGDVILVTSAYHQLRTFLTFLRVLQEIGKDRETMLWNASAPSPMHKLQGEWAKIVEYQAKGHVASYDDGLRYLEWRDACAS